jgi:hypothetical protein
MSNSILEISIVLIIILMIFGTILTSVENSTEKVIEAQEDDNMEKMISEVADNLINNPGVPEKWYEYEKGTPGLAIVNDGGEVIPNSVSYGKLIALGKNYKKLVTEKLFDSKIETSMELIPQESTISSVKIGCEEDSSSIFSITRLVKCDFYKSYVLKDFRNEGKCNRGHDQTKTSCNYFKVFPGNLKSSNYYLLIDEDEKYDLKYYIDTTRVVKERDWETTLSDVIYLNNKLDFYDDDSAVVFVHLNKPKAKAVIVSVPKDFDGDYLEYDYFRTNDCQFIVKGWY